MNEIKKLFIFQLFTDCCSCFTISGLELKVFSYSLKNDGEKWSRKKYFEIPCAPSELLLSSAEKICPEGLNWPGWLAGISKVARGISK